MKNNYSHIPFHPKRFPFFYGWAVFIFSSLGILMSLPGQTMGVSAFTEHLIKSLNISRSDLTLAYMFGTLTSAFILPYAGRMFDRVGARVMAFAASCGLGITLILLSFSDRVAGMLRDAGLGTFSLIAMMYVGFLMLRFWGQGVLTLSCRNMLMKWFDRKRGLVTGFSGPLVSLGFSVTPLALHKLISMFGWQGAWFYLGLLALFGFSMLVLIFFRDNPEDCGLLPDGEKPEDRAKKENNVEVRQYTLSEARKTFPFWILGLTLALAGFVATALPFHVVSIFKNAGMDQETAFSIFFYSSCISISMNVVWGYLSDKIEVRYLLMVMLSGLVINSFALAFLAPGFMFYLLIAGMGFGGGLFGIMTNVPFPRFYGRTHLGAINGFIMSMMVFSSAVAPWFFSKILDFTGSYKYAALCCSVAAAMLLICSFKVKNPQATK